jgi:hypothetical protein
MIIQSLARLQWSDPKTGVITEEANNFLTQLIQTLQVNLSPEGTNIPSIPTTTINQLSTGSNFVRIVHDSTLDVLKTNLNNTYKTITTS